MPIILHYCIKGLFITYYLNQKPAENYKLNNLQLSIKLIALLEETKTNYFPPKFWG